jgi:hypothetical protein
VALRSPSSRFNQTADLAPAVEASPAFGHPAILESHHYPNGATQRANHGESNE